MYIYTYCDYISSSCSQAPGQQWTAVRTRTVHSSTRGSWFWHPDANVHYPRGPRKSQWRSMNPTVEVCLKHLLIIDQPQNRSGTGTPWFHMIPKTRWCPSELFTLSWCVYNSNFTMVYGRYIYILYILITITVRAPPCSWSCTVVLPLYWAVHMYTCI